MGKRYVIYSIITGTFIALTTLAVIFFASGFRFDPDTNTIQGTGIISISSVPDGALVYVNDVPQDATNTSITGLRPGTYHVVLKKDGFNLWERDVPVKEEFVTEVKTLLIPKFPTLQPLTYTGVTNPRISHNRQKIVYTVQTDGSEGIWLVDLEERPFNMSRDPKPLLKDTPTRAYSTAQITWSPDDTQLLISLPSQTDDQPQSHYLLELGTHELTEVTDLESLQSQWERLANRERTELFATLTPEFLNEIAHLNIVAWSPDNNYVLYKQDTADSVEYYIKQVERKKDVKPSIELLPLVLTDKPVVSFEKSNDIPHKVEWFPDSMHLLIIEETSPDNTKIEIIETAGTNRTHVFTGSINDLQVYPNLSGSKIIALLRFNLDSDNYNLYSIGLR